MRSLALAALALFAAPALAEDVVRRQSYVHKTVSGVECYIGTLYRYNKPPGAGQPPVEVVQNSVASGTQTHERICPSPAATEVELRFYMPDIKAALWYRVEVAECEQFDCGDLELAEWGDYVVPRQLTDGNRDGYVGTPDQITLSAEFGDGDGIQNGEPLSACANPVCAGTNGDACPTPPTP